MIKFIKVQLQQIAVHKVGNKSLDEGIHFSENTTEIKTESTEQTLLKYFLSPFTDYEAYTLFHETDVSLNEVFSYVSKIFSNKKNLFIQSKNIAKHLYECSSHPKIKSGEFYVVYFVDIIIDNEILDAVGIFKSETKETFLKVDCIKDSYQIDPNEGININKLDKGCLIFNVNKDKGYKACIIDNHGKGSDAQYWKDDFLKIKPISNEFHQTNQFLGIAKAFVTKQLSEDFEVSKADQIDLLNRSVEYFKTHENFEKQEFEKKVFQDKGIIKSFRNFDETYRENNEIEELDSFEISQQAVKKQAKIFKSVLKLDKNFHVYIHGNRELIEQGVEKDGRRYYKIYFEKES